MTPIEERLRALRYSGDEVHDRTRAIYEATLRESRRVREGNFRAVAAEDLKRMFEQYDTSFFEGLFAHLLGRPGEAPLRFRVSSRMTSAGGKTSRTVRRGQSPRDPGAVVFYEISVSSTLLSQTFRGEGRPILVAGRPCLDRLEALQRIVEHEMIHLLEMLLWRTSSCSGARFQHLARNLFQHSASHHDLVTQHEIAGAEYSIRVGDRVSFEFEGRRLTGIVNRITQRVTVLVEHPSGRPYTDGKRYLKYYVPLPLLQRDSGSR
jgi:hypothetical protein